MLEFLILSQRLVRNLTFFLLCSVQHLVELFPSEFEAFDHWLTAGILCSLYCDQAILRRCNHFELFDGGCEPWQSQDSPRITLHCEIEACLTNADLAIEVLDHDKVVAWCVELRMQE